MGADDAPHATAVAAAMVAVPSAPEPEPEDGAASVPFTVVGSSPLSSQNHRDDGVASLAHDTVEPPARPAVGWRAEDPMTVPDDDDDGRGTANPAISVDDDDGGDFVAVELTSPSRSTASDPPATHPVALDPPDPDRRPNGDVNSTDAVAGSILANDGDASTLYTTVAPPPRRKVLRHPILTPLAKLPWEKIISAAGSCDLFFNCKYSLRQVEHEVRQERRHGSGDGDGGGEDEEWHGPDPRHAGRGDGYVNVSLGYEEGEEGIHEDESVEMGLKCCSMLDDEGDRDEESCLQEEAGDTGQEAGCTDEETGGGAREPGVTTPDGPRGLWSKKEREEVSWKSSNPSLDMMVYRTMIHE